ncbi:hypothetical protein Acr_21g0003240 [Actinidia rufa]|uniref:Uncharacterized protein n=1 Tax=Actinidia rufa TaxID=165716 RepID=A0A7J0GG22_9ERIC|nr:hypothetical protein Acr_21g0003240 [Actinidia rufa]
MELVGILLNHLSSRSPKLKENALHISVPWWLHNAIIYPYRLICNIRKPKVLGYHNLSIYSIYYPMTVMALSLRSSRPLGFGCPVFCPERPIATL